MALDLGLVALRYFYEKRPDLHVIAAGSLIDFAIESENFSMPVGRVQQLFMYPMNFAEFLEAMQEEQLLHHLGKISTTTPISEELHHRYLTLIKIYTVVGGMPAVVHAYRQNNASQEYQDIQSMLNQSFQDDFAKYSSTAKHKYLEAVFQSAPRLMCSAYKYSHVDRDTPSREIKEALHLLEKAGVLNRVRATSGHGIPMESGVSKSKFKIVTLDIGLTQRALGLDAAILLNSDLNLTSAGNMAEQFVAQELLANSYPHEKKSLYYWAREKRGSNAEVDFLFQQDRDILPLEVKAGATGSLKSLRLFLEEHDALFGVRLSEHKLSYHNQLLSIPFYLLSEIDRLVRETREANG